MLLAVAAPAVAGLCAVAVLVAVELVPLFVVVVVVCLFAVGCFLAAVRAEVGLH